jgi:uncharacterized membrane protein
MVAVRVVLDLPGVALLDTGNNLLNVGLFVAANVTVETSMVRVVQLAFVCPVFLDECSDWLSVPKRASKLTILVIVILVVLFLIVVDNGLHIEETISSTLRLLFLVFPSA